MDKLMLAIKLVGLFSLGTAGLTAQNLIDLTYGLGAGSFERGDFNNTDIDTRPDLMLVSSSMGNITGWTVAGSLGVHWLNFGSSSTTDGAKNLDLQGLNPPGSLSSITTTVPTTLGATYRLRFDAYSGNSPNSAAVSIGSLTNQSFSGGNGEFLKQNFVSYSFPFTATSKTSQGNYRTFLLPWGILRVGSGE